LIVYVSSDPFVAKSYLNILTETDLPTKYLDLSQIEQLPSLKPGVVIFGNEGLWSSTLELSDDLKTFLRNDVKLIGMGGLGLKVLNALDTYSIFGDNGSVDTQPVLLDREVPKGISAGLPTAEPVLLYTEEPLRMVNVIYDRGSFHLKGAQGIASYEQQATCKGQSWSIVKYGNYVFWGYISDVEKLTDVGKRLLVNIVKYEQETPYERPELEREYYKPGRYAGTLGCNFINNTYPIKVNKEGDIKANVTSDEEMWLVLNGPGQVRYYDRDIAVSPEWSYNVSSDLLQFGEDWFVSVYYFGDITSQTRIKYEIEIDYPYQPPNPILWLAVGILGLVLFIIAIFGLYKNFSKRHSIIKQINTS
jgi:mannose-6-phosphate isomerase-like protein (cupin superfamily)